MSLPAPQFCSKHRFRRMPAPHRGPLAGLGVLLLVTLLSRPVHAQKVVKFDVPRQGGAFVVKGNPDVLTVLSFPGKVQIAYCMQKPAPLEVEQHTHSITVRPRPGTRYASVNVLTDAFPVAILFEVVDRPEDAALQVEFRDLDLDRAFESRVQLEVERRMRGREKALEKREAALEAKEERFQQVVREEGSLHVAQQLLARHRAQRITRAERTHAAVFRVSKVVWIGDDAYVFFSVQNRGAQRHEIRAVTLRAGAAERAGPLAFSPSAAPGDSDAVAIIMPREEEHGVLVIWDAHKWRGELVTLALTTGAEPREEVFLTFTLPD